MRNLFLSIFFTVLSIPLFSQGTESIDSNQTPKENVSLASSSRALWAQQEPEPVNEPIIDLPFHVQIGGNYTYAFVYPSGLSSTSGSLGGIQALYEFRMPSRIYAGLAFAWRLGDTDGSVFDRSILQIDVQERIGYTLRRMNEIWRLSLFTGFGYRYYSEKVTAAGSSLTLYYNEFYVPVGFLLDAQVNRYFIAGLNFQWMPQVYPTVALSTLAGGRFDLSYELHNFRVEIPLTGTFYNGHFSVIFQPFFEFWEDGHTTATAMSGIALNIPRNTYYFVGADLNFRYSF